MKLRISGNSVRFRLLRSEVATLIENGHVADTIHFNSDESSALTYALEISPEISSVQLRHRWPEIAIVLPKEEAESWAQTGQVGIYATVDTGAHGSLDLVIEKDFACLDLSDANNHDTFPNPQIG